MGVDFLNDISASQVEIPAVVSRLAGFFVLMQGVLIFLQKKNKPDANIWEDLHGVMMAGLIVFLFPEIIKFIELLVNSLSHVEAKHSSNILQYIKDSNITDAEVDEGFLHNVGEQAKGAFKQLMSPEGSVATYLFTENILKPLADLVNTICFPTYWIIRACCLKIVYWIAPLVLVVGAIHPFRGLWKQWFMVYIALLISGPALILANDFCEVCFSMYINSFSPLLGFITIALARFKVFQAVVDLCYRIFKV